MSTLGFTCLALLSGTLVLLALIPGTAVAHVGRNAPLRFFDRYSYGFYVWHNLFHPEVGPWLAVLQTRIHSLLLADLAFTSTAFVFFTAVAVVSFHLLEAPFLRLKKHFRYLA